MALGQFAIWLLLWLSGITAVVIGGVLLARKRRGPGWSLLVAGVLVVLAPFAFVAYLFSPLTDPTTMQVEPLDPPNDPWFTVQLRHQRSFDNGIEYWFSAAGGPGRVVGVFQDQHPDGVVTTTDRAPMAHGEESIWHLSTDVVRYELTYNPADGWYGLTTQLVGVHTSGSGPDVRIPFPRSAFDVTAVDEGEPYANAWTQEQWADFYADITKCQVNGDTITVPTNRGGTATITLDQGTATVAVNPQPH